MHKRISKDSYIVKCETTLREYRRHVSLIRPLRLRSREFLKEQEENSQSKCKDEVSKPAQKPMHDFIEDKNDTNDPQGDWKNRLRPRRL